MSWLSKGLRKLGNLGPLALALAPFTGGATAAALAKYGKLATAAGLLGGGGGGGGGGGYQAIRPEDIEKWAQAAKLDAQAGALGLSAQIADSYGGRGLGGSGFAAQDLAAGIGGVMSNLQRDLLNIQAGVAAQNVQAGLANRRLDIDERAARWERNAGAFSALGEILGVIAADPELARRLGLRSRSEGGSRIETQGGAGIFDTSRPPAGNRPGWEYSALWNRWVPKRDMRLGLGMDYQGAGPPSWLGWRW